MTIFSFWFSNQFHATIDAVLANPSTYYSGLLPAFYRAFMSAGREVEGSYSKRCFSFPLIIAVLSLRPLLSMSTNFYSLRAARPPTVLRNSALSMGIYTGPPVGVSSFVST